jgi:hypothetical protein
MEVDGTGSTSCPMAAFGISGYAAALELVNPALFLISSLVHLLI